MARKPKMEISASILEELYFDEGKSISEIADLLGYHKTSIDKKLERYFGERYRKESQRRKKTSKVSEEELREYIGRGLSISEIAKLTDCDPSTIRKALQKYLQQDYKEIIKGRRGRKKKAGADTNEAIEYWMNISHYYAVKELSIKPKNPINSIYNYISSQYTMTESRKYLKYADVSTKPNDLPERIPLVIIY